MREHCRHADNESDQDDHFVRLALASPESELLASFPATWASIQNRLCAGYRGLPGGLCWVSKFPEEFRGLRTGRRPPPKSVRVRRTAESTASTYAHVAAACRMKKPFTGYPCEGLSLRLT